MGVSVVGRAKDILEFALEQLNQNFVFVAGVAESRVRQLGVGKGRWRGWWQWGEWSTRSDSERQAA